MSCGRIDGMGVMNIGLLLLSAHSENDNLMRCILNGVLIRYRSADVQESERRTPSRSPPRQSGPDLLAADDGLDLFGGFDQVVPVNGTNGFALHLSIDC